MAHKSKRPLLDDDTIELVEAEMRAAGENNLSRAVRRATREGLRQGALQVAPGWRTRLVHRRELEQNDLHVEADLHDRAWQAIWRARREERPEWTALLQETVDRILADMEAAS